MTAEAVVLILGGLAAFAGSIFAGVRTLREGTGARQRDLMRDIEKRADQAEHNWRQEQMQRRYFEARCSASEAGRDLPAYQPPTWVDWVDPDKRRTA